LAVAVNTGTIDDGGVRRHAELGGDDTELIGILAIFIRHAQELRQDQQLVMRAHSRSPLLPIDRILAPWGPAWSRTRNDACNQGADIDRLQERRSKSDNKERPLAKADEQSIDRRGQKQISKRPEETAARVKNAGEPRQRPPI